MIGAATGLVLLLSAQDPSVDTADALLAEKRYAEAAERYEALARERPDEPAIRVRLGASLMGLGRPAEAVPHLEAAEEMVPRDPVILRILGQAYLATGKLRRGRPAFPGAPRDHAGGAGRPGISSAPASTSWATSTARPRASGPPSRNSPERSRLTGLGMSLNALGRPGEARPVLERAVGQSPPTAWRRLALANSLTELGEFQRAGRAPAPV